MQVYRSIRVPSYIAYAVILGAGITMQYLWAAWRPEHRNEEIIAHGGLYYTGGLNEDFDVKQPQARDDNYLVLLGFFLFIETSDILQWALSNPLFVYLGRRSLSKSASLMSTVTRPSRFENTKTQARGFDVPDNPYSPCFLLVHLERADSVVYCPATRE